MAVYLNRQTTHQHDLYVMLCQMAGDDASQLYHAGAVKIHYSPYLVQVRVVYLPVADECVAPTSGF